LSSSRVKLYYDEEGELGDSRVLDPGLN
jgi:hypothetical protein